MTKFAIAYFGEPHFNSREEGAEYQKKWMAWANDLGAALVEPAIPFKKPQMVIDGADCTEFSGKNRLSGLSIVEANSLEEAIDMAKGCPHLAFGTMEVAEIMQMNM